MAAPRTTGKWETREQLENSILSAYRRREETQKGMAAICAENEISEPVGWSIWYEKNPDLKSGDPYELETTQRGFAKATFMDIYGQVCSIQKSSLATEDAIWLGVDINLEKNSGDRMHLSRKAVRRLLPLLKKFARTGELD